MKKNIIPFDGLISKINNFITDSNNILDILITFSL